MRRDQHELAAALEAEPWRFEFFQAVRLLERLAPGRQPVGRFVRPEDEVARFGANPTLTFPASEIQELERPEDGPARMRVNFMGLFGPLGVLPLYYTELVATRLRQRDRTLRDFFDLFNHRMISLFYLAWEKYRFTIAYERGERDRFSHHLLDLIGLGTPGLQDRQAVADDSLLFYSGLLAQHPRSAQALKQVLADYFEVPVEIEQFAGAWYPINRETQCAMAESERISDQLGSGAVVGDEVWDQQGRLRVRLGPMTLEQYLDFLPGGTAFEPLRGLTRVFAGDALDFEVQLILKREEVPPCEPGSETEAAPRLGWVSWLKTAPMGRDPGETVLRL
ncbi:MAG: type VI secretion system baseplate subunit TssG [Acidobacteriota bacterium]